MFKIVKQIKREVVERNKDNIYSRLFYRKISPYVTYLFVRLGISANTTTWLSAAAALIGALLVSFSNFFLTILGFIFLQLWYLLDHVDGEVARLTKTNTREGMYLDVIMHYFVHPIIYFGFGLDVANDLPASISLLSFDNVPIRRIILIFAFFAGLSAPIIDLSSGLRYEVLVATGKVKHISNNYSEVILHLRNFHPAAKSKFYRVWKIIWYIFCIPGAVLFLTLGSLMQLNVFLIPLCAFVLFPLAIYSIQIRMKNKIDTLY